MKQLSRFNELLIKYGTMFLVLNTIHYLFKFYDRSFENIWQYNLRGILFHIFFVGYGLIIWLSGIWLTIRINRLTRKHFRQSLRFVILGTFLVMYLLLFTSAYGALYYQLLFVGLKLEYLWTDYSVFNRELLLMMFVISLIIIGFHSFIYYFRHWQEAELTAERLQKENLLAQYEALKHQIEPHFFFNSLSVLNSLIHKDADLASTYISQLSKMYRYLLELKNEPVVPIEKELEFMNAYIFLMTVRHGDSIRFVTELSEETRTSIYVPKNSLQMLVENAVKHNRFSKESPLTVRITEDKNFIRVMNNLDRRELPEKSSEIGIKNIGKRYEMISGTKIELEETAFTFCIKLPKIRKSELAIVDL